MRWTSGSWGIVAMLASTLTFGAECTRDLSGEWSREAPLGTPDDAYRAEGSGWSDRIRVAQDAGRITIESFFFSRGDLQPPLKFTYLPGEGTTENVVMAGQGTQRQISGARWSECRLTITTRFPAADETQPAGNVTQTLWLESATTLVVETARGGASPNRTTYRKVAVAGGT